MILKSRSEFQQFYPATSSLELWTHFNKELLWNASQCSYNTTRIRRESWDVGRNPILDAIKRKPKYTRRKPRAWNHRWICNQTHEQHGNPEDRIRSTYAVQSRRAFSTSIRRRNILTFFQRFSTFRRRIDVETSSSTSSNRRWNFDLPARVVRGESFRPLHQPNLPNFAMRGHEYQVKTPIVISIKSDFAYMKTSEMIVQEKNYMTNLSNCLDRAYLRINLSSLVCRGDRGELAPRVSTHVTVDIGDVNM